MTIYIYTTNESSLALHILRMRGQVHNCPFESIWFAISQPLCIMCVSNIYIYFMQISHVSCIWPSGCRYLCILNTRHNSIEGIFCPGSFGYYCKPCFIPTYVFMFWNRNWVFKLTTIDVPSGLQTAWISNHMPGNMWDKITYPFPNFNNATVEVWEWIRNCMSQFIMNVITYPC